ncbi:MAG: pirin family protein [Lawsonella sp.]
MPAVTADTLTLPHIPTPKLEEINQQTYRSVHKVYTAPVGLEGDGFPVRRTFAGVPKATLDPFVHMDQMGEVDYGPREARGTDWHPHRGFETVTYIIDGEFQHQDSHGGGGSIKDGDTQWMTAGSGILHIEKPPNEMVDNGGLFHGIQLWVNLPAADKFLSPKYQRIGKDDVKLVTTADGGTLIRIIAGDIGGHTGPGSTHSPITMAHATLYPDAEMDIPWNPDFNALVYVLSGKGAVGTPAADKTSRPIREGQLAVLGAGERILARADNNQDSRSPNLELLLLGGKPIGEPVAQWGPFVMNTRAELAEAIEDYQAGRMGRVPEDGLRVYRGKPQSD